MSKYCTMCGSTTKCTDDCKDCAKECYKELKEKVGKSECVLEEAIRTELGDGAFELLRKYNYIECCNVTKNGKMYAI
jgi:hypothetical protein